MQQVQVKKKLNQSLNDSGAGDILNTSAAKLANGVH